MNYLLLQFFLMVLVIPIAQADFVKTISISQNDIIALCNREVFSVKISKLTSITDSGADSVYFKSPTPSVCSAIASQFKISGEIEISVQLAHRSTLEIVQLSPCLVGDKECSGTFRRYQLEYVSLNLNDIPLTAQKVISQSVTEYQETWSGDVCPPYEPDCDL